MKVALGCDHGGYDLKQQIIRHLQEQQIAYEDMGCMNQSSCDYPIYAKAVGKAVTTGACDRGILICTTGIGISIAANKIRGVRCALCSDCVSARLTREHNDANVLAMGAGIVGANLAIGIVDVFLHTEFSNLEKHVRRVHAIED